jgi:hypothetical protein
MPTPTGTISASDIASEFGYSGANNSISLGNYRISQTVSGMSGLSLDNEYDSNGNITKLIPQGTSAISFGNLRGRKLNVVVDYGTTSGTRSAETRYDYDIGTTIIGGFKTTKPSKGTGTKVWIHTNGTVSSDGTVNNGNTYVSMYTGSGWHSSAEIRVDITGTVSGRGGDGGRGGNAYGYNDPENGLNGGDGTAAIGINAPVIISNRGEILGGGGGGGGGGGAVGATIPGKGHRWQGNQYSVSGGGGGQGGKGNPNGGHGGAGSAGHDQGSRGEDHPGSAGTDNGPGTGGSGGAGPGNEGYSNAGGGGAGGSVGSSGTKGTDASNSSGGEDGGGKNASGGNPGGSGYAIVTKYGSVDLRGSGTRSGDIAYYVEPS